MPQTKDEQKRGVKPSYKQYLTFLCAASILSLCYLFRFTFLSQSSHPSLYLPSFESSWKPTSEIRAHAKFAVIIESRPLPNLAPLILHFSSVLGPHWPILLFTSPSMPLPLSAPFQRAIQAGHIEVRYLPATLEFRVRDEVSEFLTSPWFWEQLAPAQHILLFQADSMICSNSQFRVDDFLKFDFIGAPIDPNLGRNDEGMNGGLSLRNRTLTLDIINRWNWKEERAQSPDPMFPNVAYEDQWYYKKMKFLNENSARNNSERRSWVNLPTHEEAMKFAVETLWYDKPLGYHQVASWQIHRIDEVNKWCPEHWMATSEKMHNALA